MSTTPEDPLFDLTLTDEQRMNRDSVRRFAAAEMRQQALSADRVRVTPAGFLDRSLELGLSLLPIPEHLGGAGMQRSPIANTLNAEDLAAGDMGMALAALSPLAVVNTLLDAGTGAQQERWLPAFCSERFFAATIALMEPRALFDPHHCATTARRDGDGYRINGTKTLVPLGIDAELIVLVAMVEGEGPAAFLVDTQAVGLTRTPERHMGLATVQMARLSAVDVIVPRAARLDPERFDLERLLDLSRVGLCALATGCCQAVLDYVRNYVNERIAFGEPISHRQAVAFKVADMATELDAMRLMTWRAAARAERGLPFHEQAVLARTFCAKHAMQIGTDGVQLLGGHGFCREHPVEMWYRNLRAVGILEGVAGV
jgi:alkylation response protein AidB-like acyl-CoA dehydrogenase